MRIPANGAPNVLDFVNGRLQQGGPQDLEGKKRPFALPPKKNCDDANLESRE